MAASVTTSRYWPNLYATLYRAELHSGVVSASRLNKMLKVTDTAVELQSLREDLEQLEANPDDAAELREVGEELVGKLDAAMLDSGLLQETYAFNGKKSDEVDVDFVQKYEDFMRNAHFTLA